MDGDNPAAVQYQRDLPKPTKAALSQTLIRVCCSISAMLSTLGTIALAIIEPFAPNRTTGSWSKNVPVVRDVTAKFHGLNRQGRFFQNSQCKDQEECQSNSDRYPHIFPTLMRKSVSKGVLSKRDLNNAFPGKQHHCKHVFGLQKSLPWGT